MHIIKKYANRKLYHTNRKQYITLEGIAQLVQDNEVVQIVDNETGEDITSTILSQVVLQARGRDGVPLSANVLTSIIQLGGDRLTHLRHMLFLSLGGQDLIDAEIERRIAVLVNEGTLNTTEGQRLQQLFVREAFAQTAHNNLAAHEATMPNRNDVVRLHEQVDTLAAMVDQLGNGGSLQQDHKPTN